MKPVPTYKPSPSLAAAWEQFQARNTNPEPEHVGAARLQAATRELEQYTRIHNQMQTKQAA